MVFFLCSAVTYTSAKVLYLLHVRLEASSLRPTADSDTEARKQQRNFSSIVVWFHTPMLSFRVDTGFSATQTPWETCQCYVMQRPMHKAGFSIPMWRYPPWPNVQSRQLALLSKSERYLHILFLALVALSDEPLGVTSLHLFLLLNESAAVAPITGAVVVDAAALDLESFTNLSSFHHGIAAAMSYLASN